MRKNIKHRRTKYKYWFFGIGTWDKAYEEPDLHTAFCKFKRDYGAISGRKSKMLDGLKYQVYIPALGRHFVLEAMLLPIKDNEEEY